MTYSLLAVQDKCHCVADKYIEYELLLVSIDLILLREQAYRHILFNRSLLNRSSLVSLYESARWYFTRHICIESL